MQMLYYFVENDRERTLRAKTISDEIVLHDPDYSLSYAAPSKTAFVHGGSSNRLT